MLMTNSREEDIPQHLIDPSTGTLRYCPESIAFVVGRLTSNGDAGLKVALRGLESLFDKLFQNLNFSGVSFVAQDLCGLNFSGCNFDGVGFENALIEGAVFRGARVARAALTTAQDWPAAVAEACRRSLRTMGTTARPARMCAPRHDPWALFSEAHHLPELMVLPRDLNVDDLAESDYAALCEGRLAISSRPVAQVELAVLHGSDDAVKMIKRGWKDALIDKKHGATPSRELASARVGLGVAEAYLKSLNHQCHAGYALPTAGLLRAVRAAAEKVDAPFQAGAASEFALSAAGRPHKVGWRHPPIPFDPAVTFDENAFRVVRVFERPN